MEKETLARLAELARLNIKEDEYGPLADQIGNILSFVDTVQTMSINTTAAQGLAQTNIARPDITESYSAPSMLVEAAAKHQDGFIKVQKVL